MKIKVCGITNVSDARAAAMAGADYVGMIFEPSSPRFISADAALEISREDIGAKLVGVFVNQSADEVKAAAKKYKLSAVQLHGRQDYAFIDSIKKKGIEVWKTVWLGDENDVLRAEQIPADRLLADASKGAQLGGTGTAANWNLAAGLSAKRSLILAGGISPDNIAAAAKAVSPYALDINSGVEISPGKKDISKVKTAIENLKKFK